MNEQSFARRQERAAIQQRNLGIVGARRRLTRGLRISGLRALKGRGQPQVRSAAITSPVKALIAAVVRQPLFRSALRKVPGISRLVPGSPARVAAGEAATFGVGRGTALAVRGGAPLARFGSLARPAAKIAAVGGTFAVGEEVVKRALAGGFGRVSAPRFVTRGRQQSMPSRSLVVGQELPPSHLVVRVWQTFPGGPRFARMADGHIAVEKKDGTIKHFRPYRPVVIPRRWNARSMSRVATALKRQRKVATKILQITGGVPKRK